MELAEYSLKDYLMEFDKNNNEIKLEEGRKIFTDILKCVYHLHTNGYSHFDIKPANILYFKNID